MTREEKFGLLRSRIPEWKASLQSIQSILEVFQDVSEEELFHVYIPYLQGVFYSPGYSYRTKAAFSFDFTDIYGMHKKIHSRILLSSLPIVALGDYAACSHRKASLSFYQPIRGHVTHLSVSFPSITKVFLDPSSLYQVEFDTYLRTCLTSLPDTIQVLRLTRLKQNVVYKQILEKLLKSPEFYSWLPPHLESLEFEDWTLSYDGAKTLLEHAPKSLKEIIVGKLTKRAHLELKTFLWHETLVQDLGLPDKNRLTTYPDYWRDKRNAPF